MARAGRDRPGTGGRGRRDCRRMVAAAAGGRHAAPDSGGGGPGCRVRGDRSVGGLPRHRARAHQRHDRLRGVGGSGRRRRPTGPGAAARSRRALRSAACPRHERERLRGPGVDPRRAGTRGRARAGRLVRRPGRDRLDRRRGADRGGDRRRRYRDGAVERVRRRGHGPRAGDDRCAGRCARAGADDRLGLERGCCRPGRRWWRRRGRGVGHLRVRGAGGAAPPRGRLRDAHDVRRPAERRLRRGRHDRPRRRRDARAAAPWLHAPARWRHRARAGNAGRGLGHAAVAGRGCRRPPAQARRGRRRGARRRVGHPAGALSRPAGRGPRRARRTWAAVPDRHERGGAADLATHAARDRRRRLRAWPSPAAARRSRSGPARTRA